MNNGNQIHSLDERTLGLARKIVRLSMENNDMAAGARACAYSLLLLSRLISNFNDPKVKLPQDFTEAEENLLDEFLNDVEPVVLQKTSDVPMQVIVQQLMQEALANRHQRRANGNNKPKNNSRKKPKGTAQIIHRRNHG